MFRWTHKTSRIIDKENIIKVTVKRYKWKKDVSMTENQRMKTYFYEILFLLVISQVDIVQTRANLFCILLCFLSFSKPSLSKHNSRCAGGQAPLQNWLIAFLFLLFNWILSYLLYYRKLVTNDYWQTANELRRLRGCTWPRIWTRRSLCRCNLLAL